MRRICLGLALLLAAEPTMASCWAEYDSCMHGILARQGISAPSRAASFSSMAECRSALSSMMSDPVYRGDACLGRTRCQCDGGSGGASGGYSGGGGSFEQQVVAMAMNAFFNALFASDKAGPSAEALRAEAQRKWADLEKVRLDSEKRVAERAFAAAKVGALKDLGGRPPPSVKEGPVIKEGGTPALLRGDWKKAVQAPGLSQAGRSTLRMSLPVDASGGASIDLDGVLRERDALSAPDVAGPLMPLLEGSATYGVGAAVEQGAEALLSGAYGEKALQFGDAYAVGGVAMAFANGKKEEAAAPAVNWAIGKIPGAGMAAGTAQGVAAVTTKVFRKSWDNFTEQVEGVVPGVLPEGGAEAFWQEMKDDATAGQRGVFEWLGL